jgi:site-specific DNA-methyltransferase (adenine-specific)
MLELNKIYNMDCIEGMKLLPDNSIDLVVTSPPYDGIRDYKGFSLDLHSVGVEISRILKDGGICVMVIQDQTKKGRKTMTSFRTILDWDDNTELDVFEICIYNRNGTPGAWWNKRFRVDHEYIPIFIKGQKPQYFNKEHMKILPKKEGVQKSGGSRFTSGEVSEGFISTGKPKCCGTVIKYASSSQEGINKNIKKIKAKHPATFPDKLAMDFIQCFTTERMIVLDPFMGSGTVAAMAKKLNRKYIGFEINKEYCEIAENRIKELK